MNITSFERNDRRLGQTDRPGILGRMRRLLARHAATASRNAEARQAEAVLNSLPDRLLKDMGLARGDIAARVFGHPAE